MSIALFESKTHYVLKTKYVFIFVSLIETIQWKPVENWGQNSQYLANSSKFSSTKKPCSVFLATIQIFYTKILQAYRPQNQTIHFSLFGAAVSTKIILRLRYSMSCSPSCWRKSQWPAGWRADCSGLPLWVRPGQVERDGSVSNRMDTLGLD